MRTKLAILRILIVVAVGIVISYFSPKIISGSTDTSNDITLDSLHQALGEPLPGEWLSIVKEPGQTFAEYKRSDPKGRTNKRTKLYIRPIGGFSETELEILQKTSEYLNQFYTLPVVILDSISLELIPKSSQRNHQNKYQASAKFILNNLMAPHIPDDAAGYIAFTKVDLYNDPEKNFVFGLANLKNRAGVYSMSRFGNADASEHEKRTFILRILKVASHELGHIFSIKHCIEFKCIMNGSNSLQESDSKPVYLCPIDLKKICWNLNLNAADRHRKLNAFWRKNGFEQNSEFYYKSAVHLDTDIFNY
jgi:archaemetzincin